MLSTIYSFIILTASAIASDDMDDLHFQTNSICDDDYIDYISISTSDSLSTLLSSYKTNSHESKHGASNNERTFGVNQILTKSSDPGDRTNEYDSTNNNTLGSDVQRFIYGNSSVCTNLASVKLAARQFPNLETFVDSFIKAMLAVPALQNQRVRASRTSCRFSCR